MSLATALIAALPPGRLQIGAQVLTAARPLEKPRVLWLALLTVLRRVPRLAPYVPEEAWIRLHGFWFLVALAQAEMEGFVQAWSSGSYEAGAEFRARPGDVIVDGGASVGFYAVRQAARGARVVAFEPNPKVYRRLQQGLVRNRLDGVVHAIPAALGEGSARRPFFVEETNTIGGTVLADFDDAPRQQAAVVEVVTIDESLRRLGIERVAVIKLDVEGAECMALHGASQALASARALVMEYHSETLRTCCVNHLEAAGMSILSDDGRHLSCVPAGRS